MMHSLGSLHINKAQQSGVKSAIQQASAKTGVDFGYLVKQAEIESSMNPNAKARTSSATGLYQFIDQTWLRMVKTHGAEHGLEKYANAIEKRSNGNYVVRDQAMKSDILNLRRDPKTSSMMAAELATENHDTLQKNVGRDVKSTDLYMAHFLGAQGASNFLNSMQKNPWAPAASLFPDAAKSNRNVFYENGKPLTLQQVYNKFDSKFEGKGAPVTEVADNQTFVRRVVLPRAADWSNPGLSNQSLSNVRVGGFLSSPVDIMEMAQMRYAHDDNNRYNS
jgi:hypothetical protein